MPPPDVEAWPVPYDTRDVFFGAGWRRPEVYLDAEIRANMSAGALADPEGVKVGAERLAEDLSSGKWYERHHDLRGREVLDVGYRFLVTP